MARKANTFLVTVVCLLFVVDANAAMSGNDWKRLGPGEQLSYIMGVLDTWKNLERVEAKAKSPVQPHSWAVLHYRDALNCIQPMTFEQTVAIIQKYLENNPSAWHYAMPSLVWTALKAACPVPSK